MAKEVKRCIVPGCKGKQLWRGVCTACYFAAKRRINKGEITDAELVKRKLLLKSNRTGRPTKNPLSKILSK